HMSLRQSLHERVERLDVLGLALMSLGAPWIAAYIHSASVFHRGIRLYNAEVGGMFLHPKTTMHSSIGTILMWIAVCAVPAAPTLLVLLAFRKRIVYRWLAWLCCIAVWTWVSFKMEIARH